MNGFQTKIPFVVIDTNILFMALYNPSSKAGEVIEAANKNKIKLYSPDSVKEELSKVLLKEMAFSKEETEKIIMALPVNWIEKEIYKSALEKVKVKHKPDKPVEAVALILECKVLSADRDFKDRLNVNELLKKIKE